MSLQKTIKSEARISGKGMFGGKEVKVTFRPASADSGVVFVRTDIQEPVRIGAVARVCPSLFLWAVLYWWAMEIKYRNATMEDLAAIIRFVDYWLTGGAERDHVPGATHDFFIPFGRQKKYLARYDVLLAICERAIVGWAVKTDRGILIHLLVAVPFRGRGIGGEMLRRLSPEIVRSKMDQKSGDPADFYMKYGYYKLSCERLGKKENIELFVKVDKGEDICDTKQKRSSLEQMRDLLLGGSLDDSHQLSESESAEFTAEDFRSW